MKLREELQREEKEYERKVLNEEINAFYGLAIANDANIEAARETLRQESEQLQKTIAAEIADTIVKTAESNGTIEYYIDFNRTNEYFNSLDR